jgi:hypothetical protein
MYQLGTHHSDIVLPPPTPSEPYPEFPVEVDDQYILPHQILGQPDGIVSLLTGFNQCIKIYMSMNGLVSVELSYVISTLPFHDQRAMLDESLRAVKQMTDGLPQELTIDLNLGSGQPPSHGLPLLHPGAPPTTVFDDSSSGLHYCPLYPGMQQQQQQPTPDFRHQPSAHTERRRLLQYEIQKANIHASQLATRSYYVERYISLRDAHRDHARAQAAQASFAAQQQQNGVDTSSNNNNNNNNNSSNNNAGGGGDANTNKSVAAAALHAAAEQADAVDLAMTAERDLIVQHLLTVLSSVSQRSMEPNGASLINKIRQIASTLVSGSGGHERKGPVAVKAQESLGKFVEILMRLERIPPGGTGGDGGVVGLAAGEDEEQELRSWADLREHQVRFLQGGGFMGLP